MKYTVWIKREHDFTWKPIKNVVGDFWEESPSGEWIRVLYLENGEFYQFPCNTSFRFSKEREMSRLKKMSAESGQQIVRADG